MALPLCWGGRTKGMLFAESTQSHAFGDEEDPLAVALGQVSTLLRLLELEEPAQLRAASPLPAQDGPIRVRRFGPDNTIFLDHDYLIKGIAGAVFWTLVSQHLSQGRVEFINRELRLDPSLRLPGLAENLEARLILLQRRLEERQGLIRMEKSGRGRFRLCVAAPLELVEMDGAEPERAGAGAA